MCNKIFMKKISPEKIPPQVLEPLQSLGGLERLSELMLPTESVKKNVTLFKALSDPFRIKILSMLAIQPLCVCIIREMLQISDTRLSYHLRKLSSNGLIEGRSQGNWIIYELTDLRRNAVALCSKLEKKVK